MFCSADLAVITYCLQLKIEALKTQAASAFDRGFPKHASAIRKIIVEYQGVQDRVNAAFDCQKVLERLNAPIMDL